MTNIVPDGWSCLDLGSHIKIGRGYAFKSEDYKSQGLPIVRVTNIENDGRLNLLNNVVYLDHNEAEKYSNFKLATNDVLIVMVGATVGKLAKVERMYSGALLNQNMWRLVVKSKSDACQEFLYHSIRPVVDKFLSSQQGSARGFLTQQGFALAEILLPPLPEQQKIATILSSVDDVIEKTRAQIDKLKDLKTGMMQELLTKGIGHTEFKDSEVGLIPRAWSVVTLDSLVNTIESGWSPQCESNPAGSGEWAVLKTTAVTWSGFDFRANKKLPEQLEPRPAIQVEPHDILITRAGPSERVGVVSYVTYVPSRIMLSDKLIRIKANQDQNPQFLSFWLSTEFVRSFFAQRTTGLAQSQTNISQEILKSVPCAIPPLAEQNVISNAIAALERELNLKREILQHKKSLKKALMQDLLTGKVRVKLTDKESAVV